MTTRTLCWSVVLCLGPVACDSWQRRPRWARDSALPASRRRPVATRTLSPVDEARVSLDKNTFKDLMAVLPQLEPSDRDRLLAQIKDMDPALVPAVLRQFRATLAIKNKAQSKAASARAEGPPAERPDGTPTRPAQARAPSARDTRLASARPGPALLEAINSTPRQASGDVSSQADRAATGSSDAAPKSTQVDRDLPPVRFGSADAAAQDKPAVRANASASLKTETDAPKETSTQRWQRLVKEIQGVAVLRSKDAEVDARTRVAHCLLHWVGRQEGSAIKALDPLPQDEASLFRQIVLTLFSYFDRDEALDASDQATRALDSLESAVHLLRQRAELRLKELVFCRRVTSYGAYVAFAKRDFTTRQRVLVYCAVENFASEQAQDGMYRTQMSSVLTVYDTAGHRAWTKEFPDTEDRSSVPRRDYFHTYDFRLPLGLKRGQYTLMASVQDKLANKVAEKRITFSIH